MANPTYTKLEFPESDLAVLTLDAPEKSVNILSRKLLVELDEHFAQLETREDLAGLILQSAKEGNFIAGADLKEFVASLNEPKEKLLEFIHHGQQLFGRLAKMPFVTVAAINATCVGGGAELAVWCDRRVMTRQPKPIFGFPEVKLGLFPGWGGTARTPRIVGLGNAVEMITGGESITPQVAYAMGLASIAPEGQLLEAATRLVRQEQQSKSYQQDRARWTKPLRIDQTELGFLGATASAYIQQQTKGHYPAPLAALEVMLESASEDIETACQIEADNFVELFGSPVNRALLNVFFLTDRNKKITGAEGVEPQEVKSASVVGAGIMGQGIAAANIKRQIPVALGDVSAEAVARGVQGIVSEVSYNKQTRAPDVERALKFMPLVNGTVSNEELAASDIVIEAIFEDLDAKRSLFAKLESLLPDSAVLCSNTSTIPITELATNLKRPERFCGLHFFNPVRKMPLVEVIRGEKTSDQTIVTAVAYAKAIGKSPIVMNDGPGFLVNRVLMPYMNEALLLLEEGATIKEVDRAATKFGMPMGPITLYDTVGLDVALHAGRVLQAAFPDRTAPSRILPAMVEAGRLGKKTGKGFFDYDATKKNDRGTPSDEVDALVKKLPRDSREFSMEEIRDRLFMPMFLEATRAIEDGVVHDVRDVDLGLIYGIGFPPHKGGLFFWADTLGAEAIVEKLNAYKPLGERFEPTAMLLEYAKSGKKFYE